MFKLILLIRFYCLFDFIFFYEYFSKDVSNNRIWVISLFIKNKKFILMYIEFYKIKYLFDMIFFYKFVELFEVVLFILF